MAERVERRLTTIIAADVAEYSRLMRADEDGTLAALTTCRAIIDKLIAEHRGRIANTAGDSVLAELPSVAEGLSCALAIQKALGKHSERLPLDRQMRFRIGVHLGDVMIRSGDMFAMPLTLRLACRRSRSRAAFASRRRCASTSERAMPRHLLTPAPSRVKNIAEPVHVFHVAAPESGQATDPPAALPLPDKPSVAVLPFTNMSTDSEQEFVADGMAEDVITALSRYPSLFVIARNSSFTYKGRAVDVKRIGRELGVRYVLEGSLRKSGNRVRVTAQLVEAETGKHVWAERYDRDLADIFAVQDEITEAVAVAVAPAIADAELHRALRKPPESLDAWAAYQRGMWHYCKTTPGDNAIAQKFFQHAVDLDPNFSGFYAGLAMAQNQASDVLGMRGLLETLSSAEALTRRAVALDGADAEARSLLCSVLCRRGDYEGAVVEAERALATAPNLSSAHHSLGFTLIHSGRPKEGLAALERSIRLDPRSPRLANAFNLVAIAFYFCHDYEAAIAAAKRAIRAYPEFPNPYRWLAAALGQVGRIEEAKEALEKAIAVAPAGFAMYVGQRMPWHRPEDYAHMLEGLRKAGWQG
ncbi:MAG: tetratricopeptide repeat protein [Alphaproteobacteria bacterium]|nr:tetratricopeptide repeat protein [Alphaproteobacteria bacterium]